MTISYPLDLPGSPSDIAGITLIARNQISMSESPFTFGQQVYEHQGQRWELTVELNRLTRTDAEPWIAFLMSLRGRYGTFMAGDPTGTVPRGSAGGTPRVRNNSQSGLLLTCYGFTSSATNILRAGDYIQLGTGGTASLHKVLQDTNTTSGGVCTLDIWPRLRTSPSSGDAITVNSCMGRFRLGDNATPWIVRAPNIYEITFTAVEDL